MNLRTHPKLTWRGKPVWDPSAWHWLTTIGGTTSSAEGIEKYGRLLNIRQFREKKGVAAIEILVRFDQVVYSTVIRLDDPTVIAGLLDVLDSLHGYSLNKIGSLRLSPSSQIIRLQSPRTTRSAPSPVKLP